MGSTAHLREHPFGVAPIMGFTEDFAVAFRYGVAANDETSGIAGSDIGRFLLSVSQHQLRRRFPFNEPRFGIIVGRVDLECVVVLGEQLLSPRRLAGENQGRWQWQHRAVRSLAFGLRVAGRFTVVITNVRRFDDTDFIMKAGAISMHAPEVLYEDNHLIAVNKPAGIATMGAERGSSSLLDDVKMYLKRKYDKPGNVYLGVVSRLDALVTGVIIFARTSKSAARMTSMFGQRTVDKSYWALVSPAHLEDTGRLQHWLVKNEGQHRMETCSAKTSGAKRAELSYNVCGRSRDRAAVTVALHTGRKHQIRVQLAALGCPIVGDRKYGSRVKFPSGIALHARQLKFEHPVRRTPIDLTAPLPRAWSGAAHLFQEGGDRD